MSHGMTQWQWEGHVMIEIHQYTNLTMLLRHTVCCTEVAFF